MANCFFLFRINAPGCCLHRPGQLVHWCEGGWGGGFPVGGDNQQAFQQAVNCQENPSLLIKHIVIVKPNDGKDQPDRVGLPHHLQHQNEFHLICKEDQPPRRR